MKKFTILMCILTLGGVYSVADAQTYNATVSQQQAVNNASRVESLSTIVKASNMMLNNKINDVNSTIVNLANDLNTIKICNTKGKIHNPTGASPDVDGCITVAPVGNQTVYQCPLTSSANGVSAGPWASYGCRGQIGLAPRCHTIVFPQNQWRNCTPIGKMYMSPL